MARSSTDRAVGLLLCVLLQGPPQSSGAVSLRNPPSPFWVVRCLGALMLRVLAAKAKENFQSHAEQLAQVHALSRTIGETVMTIAVTSRRKRKSKGLKKQFLSIVCGLLGVVLV